MSKEFYSKLWDTKLGGKAINSEIVNRRKNGDVYIASAHIAPIKNNVGEVIGFISSEEDITYLRRAEQKALENEERFIQLVEKIPEIYWITELIPAEKVVYVSPAFEQIWGIPQSVLYDNPRVWVDHIHPEDRQVFVDTFNKFLESRSALDTEFRIIRPDGQILTLHIQGEQVLDEAGKIIRIVGVVRDVTKEKIIDREKTEFVSFASHQLKTPITAIQWNLDTLLAEKYGAIPPKQREILQGIYTMNSRSNELINSLLNLSRIEAGVFIIEPIPTDFVKI